ncbi:MAG: hypothetical protein LBN36_04325 [Clostridiales Family XIII bacterium]|jgi:flagellar basal body-associated protein FliL|nr:hypothetical protein [Clostridiales Family XIII bacterium]
MKVRNRIILLVAIIVIGVAFVIGVRYFSTSKEAPVPPTGSEQTQDETVYSNTTSTTVEPLDPEDEDADQ